VRVASTAQTRTGYTSQYKQTVVVIVATVHKTTAVRTHSNLTRTYAPIFHVIIAHTYRKTVSYASSPFTSECRRVTERYENNPTMRFHLQPNFSSSLDISFIGKLAVTIT